MDRQAATDGASLTHGFWVCLVFMGNKLVQRREIDALRTKIAKTNETQSQIHFQRGSTMLNV